MYSNVTRAVMGGPQVLEGEHEPGGGNSGEAGIGSPVHGNVRMPCPPCDPPSILCLFYLYSATGIARNVANLNLRAYSWNACSELAGFCMKLIREPEKPGNRSPERARIGGVARDGGGEIQPGSNCDLHRGFWYRRG